MCEFLHCSPSELPSKCPETTDEQLIIAYLARKTELENQAIKK